VIISAFFVMNALAEIIFLQIIMAVRAVLEQG
jgi:hypothetical protein